MPVIPIYITSLELENIKTFGKVKLNLRREDGVLPQWTLILGDNGIGKSTLLQCMAWMKPYLPYDKKEVPDDFIPAPIVNDEENEVLTDIVRKSLPLKKDANLKAIYEANIKLGMKAGKSKNYCETVMEIAIKSDASLSKVLPSVEMSHEELFYDNEVMIYAYSASRTVGKQNLGDSNLDDTIPAFIAEKTILYDVEEILHTANYAALGSKGTEKTKYSNFLNRVKNVLASILPDVGTISNIDITVPKLVGNKLMPGEVLISTNHGKNIPFRNFSLGYRTVASWTVDLAWRLFNKYPPNTIKNPLEGPAIVLIDEIDLHLHPVWQREIISELSLHFPNVQFIATAHSPLMVQAALGANYAVLEFSGNHVDVINELEGIDGWRIDQILTSDFFGLRSARGLEYDNLYSAREYLIRKERLTVSEKKDLNRITQQLTELPSGETAEEIENKKLIKEVVSKIKRKKPAIHD